MVDDLYNYAKFQYECGNYQEATEYLYIYKVLVGTTLSTIDHLTFRKRVWESNTLLTGGGHISPPNPSHLTTPFLFFLQDEKNGMSALWGKLASEILLQNWDSAFEDFNRLKEVIDSDV